MRTRYLNKKPLTEALRLFVTENPLRACGSERVRVEDSLGRVTAEAVFARVSVPHYHGAAMDGIALRAADTFGASEATPVELRRSPSPAEALPGTFVPIDTGQPLPPWADAVVMIENVYPLAGDRVELRAAALPWQHVRLVGEDIVASEPLLPRAHRIRPYDIGALLAAGHVEVAVVAQPSVAIIPTGSELVEPGAGAPPGGIVEFNSRVVAAFVEQWGGRAERRPAVADDLAAIEAAISAAAAQHDVVVVIAGSSAGEHDYTVHAARRLGEVLVHGIEVMPGKPAICAMLNGRPLLGLPGYPVSAVVVCRELLRPLLAKLQRVALEPPPTVRALVPRKLPSRLGLEELVRVTLGKVGDRIVANPLARGAGVITSMVRADGLLRIGALSEGINAGEEVDVELLRPAAEIARTIVFSGSHDLTIGVLDDCLRQRAPELRISASNTGSLGGLIALGRGEAHLVGTHLLDAKTATYNLPDIRRLLGVRAQVVIVNLVIREQGLIVAPGNPKRIAAIRDLVQEGVVFVNRQPGAGTRVLLDHLLARARIPAARIRGYEREELTHMAVAVAVASGLADCGLGVRSAAQALGLDFVPIEKEEYDLVLRRDFAESKPGALLLEVISSAAFKEAALALGGYDVSKTGTRRHLAATRGAGRAHRSGRRT